jgi:hypothetical protein
VQEVELHVKRSPAWQETQDVDREVRELAATRKVFRVSDCLQELGSQSWSLIPCAQTCLACAAHTR